ncbi:uncharacterized protein LOC111126499 [Crassostrea virginica]
MSDSEDDAAFASADEGEPEPSPVAKSTPVQESKPKEKKGESKESKAEKDKSESRSDSVSKPKGNEKKTATKNSSTSKAKESVKPEGQPVKKQEEKSKGGKGKKKKGKQTKTEPVAQESVTKSKRLSIGDTEEVEENKTTPVEATQKTQEKKDGMINSSDIEKKLNISDARTSKVSETVSNKNEDPAMDKTIKESQSEEINVKAEPSVTEKETSAAVKKEEIVNKEVKETPKREIEAKSALDRLSQPSKQKADSWGSWGNWGSSFMNVASTSVSTFGNQLGEGFTTIMDTVETALGAPPVDELVKESIEETPPDTQNIEREEKQVADTPMPIDAEKMKENPEKMKEEPGVKEANPPKEPPPSKGASGGGGWWSGWGMSNLSNLSSVVHNTTNIVQKSVQSTSNIVQKSSKTFVTGGLDVLETIGKKTFEVIKEHDPGLSRTREFLFEKTDKPSLSQLLREAQKEEEDKEERKKEEDEARLTNFKALFEENQGYAHLEALEMLSNMCEKTVHSLLEDMSDRKLDSIKAELIRIKQVFERMQEENDLDEEEDKEHEFGKLVAEHLTEIHLGTTPDKLNKTQEKIREVIAKYFASDDFSVKELHRTAIQSLAEFTSKSLEQFHKAGELIILQRDTSKHCESRAHSLEKLAKVLSTEVGIIATKFCHCLNKLDENENPDITSVVTNIYLESSNSTMYIQDALQLLLPCLQQAAIQRSLT